MNFLFLDSSYYLQFGLVDDNLEWIDFREIRNRKGSSLLHGELYKLLRENHFQIEDVGKIVLGGGPGSYTGIRLAEGIAQIFEWQKVEINSFYYFEIPYFSGVEEGTWCAEAFKGEIFLYEWNKDKSQHSFMKEDQFKAYTPSHGELYQIGNTTELLRKHPQKAFSRILKRKQRFSPFYFRADEREFRIPSK